VIPVQKMQLYHRVVVHAQQITSWKKENVINVINHVRLVMVLKHQIVWAVLPIHLRMECVVVDSMNI
jgi:hypothetical protein